MRRPRIAASLVGLLLSLIAGCGQSQVTVPPGGQLVHLVATETEVKLDVASVRAGDVFVQLDDPADGGSFTFVERKVAADDNPGPLTDDDLERVAHGDTRGTSISAYGPSCVGPQGSDRGHLVQEGVCGDVWIFALVPGKYAILGPGWTQRQTEASVTPPPILPVSYRPRR